MPLLTLRTNLTLDDTATQALLAACSSKTASLLGKPERYVMIEIVSGLAMLFAGSDDPCARLELKSLGLPEQSTAEFSRGLCMLVTAQTGIPAERIYIEFSSPARHLWGWNGATF